MLNKRQKLNAKRVQKLVRNIVLHQERRHVKRAASLASIVHLATNVLKVKYVYIIYFVDHAK